MAFIDQVQDLTSLTVSDTDELSQFLKDGVIDVTNRWLAIRPQDIELFQRESTAIENNGDIDLKGAKIISVIREAGADGSSDGSTAWEPCRKIPASMQSRVVDVNSLHYASKYNPVYTIMESNEVHVYPTPDGTNDSFKVFYVNHVPKDLTNGAALIHSHSDINYFPADKVYLVVIYAGIRLLNATMGSSVISITAVPPDVPTLTTVSFSAPTAPSTPSDPSISSPGVTTVTIGSLGTVPTLTSTTLTSRVAFASYWTVADFGDSDPGELNITAVPPDTPDAPELSEVGTAPTYDTSVATSALVEANNFIDDEEDVELANAKLAEVQALMQDELNEFNQENIAFQATIQRETQEDTLILQKYQADLAVYQAEVGAQVQEYTQKLQRYTLELNTVFQAWQKTESDSLQQYQLDLQANLNEFNEDNVIYQSTVQEAIQNATIAAQEAQKEGDLELQARIQDYTQELALFGGEVQKYQSEIQSGVQTMQAIVGDNQALLTKYQAEIAEYQAEIAAETQEQSVKMQQYQLLYNQLKAEYDQAFMIAAPKQQPQQQVRV